MHSFVRDLLDLHWKDTFWVWLVRSSGWIFESMNVPTIPTIPTFHLTLVPFPKLFSREVWFVDRRPSVHDNGEVSSFFLDANPLVQRTITPAEKVQDGPLSRCIFFETKYGK